MRFTNKNGRNLHIIGTKGEIDGFMETGKFIVRRFDRGVGNFGYSEELVDVNADAQGGHGGGDYAIMHELGILNIS